MTEVQRQFNLSLVLNRIIWTFYLLLLPASNRITITEQRALPTADSQYRVPASRTCAVNYTTRA